ncbi:hypothetical protein [Amycolatopsis sp. NPDC003731]
MGWRAGVAAPSTSAGAMAAAVPGRRHPEAVVTRESAFGGVRAGMLWRCPPGLS